MLIWSETILPEDVVREFKSLSLEDSQNLINFIDELISQAYHEGYENGFEAQDFEETNSVWTKIPIL